ncbi:MAG: DNA polymerase III subunit delta' [Candidatus Aureabacteria bacterium]|nr:DNA polymerase III subunit delta' [Candidatus Auribacterota bacterium]
MAFRDIKGQGSAVGLLEKSIASGRLAHSYLFHGPEGVGKELAARNFAKVLNCVAPICGDACERCENCLRAEKGTHPDLLWLRPEGKVRVIKIDTIREFQHSIAMRPYMGRWKVGIFVDAHTLQHREEAAHALLKTLEEPPAHTILILVTARPELLLPTIISRCQSVRFSAMPVKDLAPLLEKRHALSEREAADCLPRGDCAPPPESRRMRRSRSAARHSWRERSGAGRRSCSPICSTGTGIAWSGSERALRICS